MDFVKKGKLVIETEIAGLRHVQKLLDGDFEKAVQLMLEVLAAKRKFIVIGVGKSGNVGHKIAATLTSTGAPSIVLDASDAVHGDMGVVAEGDLILALSYSGETEELLRLLPFLKRFNVKMIAMTGYPRSTLARHADIHIDVHIPKEACPLNLAPTSSTTAMMAMGDALAMVILEARGFRKEDFARFHPGGQLGRNLLTRVQDVMRPLDQVAMLSETATVRDALSQWNLKRAGAVIVTGEKTKKGKIVGIYTHGDFVRGYQADAGVGERRLSEVMTRGPITVRVDKLAVEVLNVFQQHRIDDLVVVDAQQRPVGLVDAQDIAKLKLM
jgi:arabinose-5-phosphate isomerase